MVPALRPAFNSAYPRSVVDIELPYGRSPTRHRIDGDVVVAVARGPGGPPPVVADLLDRALESPIESPRLEALVRPGDRVTVVVSDVTRAEPRAAMLSAILARLPSVHLTVAVATGTHGPCDPVALGLPDALLARATLVMHDGHRDDDLLDLGTTRRGTPVRLHRCAVEADLVVATGAIRPHYFAGFGAGIKAIYPGLGGAAEIRINHRLKQEPGARAGVVVGNPCRDDLEEVAAMLPTRPFLLDVVCDPDDVARDAVAGDVIAAFRAGAERARPWFEVHAPRTRCVVASDALPVTATLYQASKIVAAVASLLEDGGTIVLVAECADGIGGIDIVNRAIYEIGLAPRLPRDHRIVLVSSLGPEEVAPSYARWARSVEDALAEATGPIVVVPHASKMIFR